jgi:hypothetical protein
MIPLTKFRELLKDYAKTLSDEEVENIRRDMYILADIAFDFWEKDNGLKK